jgi:hypothetical protein
MTAGFGLAGAPSSVIYAKRLQVSIVKFIGVLSISASYCKAFEGLERLDAKVSRAVLRGERRQRRFPTRPTPALLTIHRRKSWRKKITANARRVARTEDVIV